MITVPTHSEADSKHEDSRVFGISGLPQSTTESAGKCLSKSGLFKSQVKILQLHIYIYMYMYIFTRKVIQKENVCAENILFKFSHKIYFLYFLYTFQENKLKNVYIFSVNKLLALYIFFISIGIFIF